MNSIDTLDSDHTDGSWLKGLATLFFTLIMTVIFPCIHGQAAYGANVAQSQVLLQAKGLVGEEAFKETLESPSGFVRESPGSPEANLNLGKAAFENRDYSSAISAFERAAIDPAGEEQDVADDAMNPGGQHFNEAPGQNPSDAAGLSIGKQLQAMKSSKQEHFVSAKISLGLDLDDNENVDRTSLDSGISTTLGNIMTVTVDRPEKTQIYTSTATVSYLFQPIESPFSWKMSGTSYNAVYRHNEDLDVNLSDFKAGASIGKGRIRWEIYGLSNRLNLDYSRYLYAYGAGSSLYVTVTPSFLLNLDGKIKKKNYFTDDSRDAENVSFTLSPILAYGRSRLSLSLGLEYENARQDVNTFSKLSGIATYEARLPLSSKIYVSYWYQETGYGDIYPVLSMKRDDTVQYITTGLSKAASLWKSPTSSREMAISMSYTYTRAESTIELDSYTKKVLSAGMSMVF